MSIAQPWGLAVDKVAAIHSPGSNSDATPLLAPRRAHRRGQPVDRLNTAALGGRHFSTVHRPYYFRYVDIHNSWEVR
jgi:hypothetical protein